jgi:uncharacterized membrane protein
MNLRSAMAAQGLPGRILSVVAGMILLVVALTFSLLLFAVVAAGALIFWLYLSWKTRGMQRPPHEEPPGGRIFEGEVIREAEPAATRIAQPPEN